MPDPFDPRLRGLDATAAYVVTDLDAPGGRTVTGKALAERGLEVTIDGKPGAAVVTLRKVARGVPRGAPSP